MNVRARFFQLVRKGLRRGASPLILKQVKEFQKNESEVFLRQLLLHAVQHVPYYSRLLAGGEDLLVQFKNLPVLTKHLIRRHFEDLKSRDLMSRKWYLNSSGGSTGKPITVLQDREFRDWGDATEQFFCVRLMGIGEYQIVPKVYIWGSEMDLFEQTSMTSRFMNWMAARIFINAFLMKSEEFHRTVRVINRRRPVVIKGYAGSLYELSRFIEKHGLKVHSPTAIYSAAESLRPFMRDVIERVFDCKAFDYYGSREVGAIAGECCQGKIHLFNFNNFIEVVNENNKQVFPGEEGRVLVTTLHNFAMPLIRYDIGDTAVLGNGCTCGLDLPVLKRVSGRVTDHFVTRQGALVNGEYFTHLFYYRNWLSEFQIVQKEVEKIVIYYVASVNVPEKEAQDIEHKIRIVMGTHCLIEWKRCNDIPRTPQGKFLYTMSLVTSSSKAKIPDNEVLK